jgi:hypothetical protein
MLGTGLLLPVEGRRSEFVLTNLTRGHAVVLYFGDRAQLAS